ncbi:MAG: serine protease [Mycobacterium sp.]
MVDLRKEGVVVFGARRWLRLAAAVVPLAAMLPGPPSAFADGGLPLGGGAGIVVDASYCTLTTIGHDGAGDLVGFTSAHCGGPGAQVFAEGTAGTVGNVVATDDDLDYALIKFDPAKVTAIPDFAGFAINGIGPDPIRDEIACKQSRASGNACADVWGPGPDPATLTIYECGDPDDDGAPVTVNDLLIGMVRGGFTQNGSCPIPWAGFIRQHLLILQNLRPEVVLISAILADVNAKGGPGAGFVPVLRPN